MAQQPAHAEHTNAAAAAAYRVVLSHLGSSAAVCTERQLARAACVCAAWRLEAGVPEHHAVMRFQGPASRDVVARELVRHAAVVTELHATFLLRDLGAALPPDAHFPRLTRVVECCAPPSAEAAPPPHAVLRAAPLLTRWRTGAKPPPAPRVDGMPSAMAAALREAADAEALSLQGIFTPARGAAGARVRDRALPPGAAGLLRLLAHAAQSGVGSPIYDPDAAKHFLDDDAPFTCDDDEDGEERPSALASFGYIMERLAEQDEEELADTADFFLHPLFAATALSEALRQRRAARTLLHAAVERASVAVVAVLLRHGADPLAGDGASALARCALDVSELVTYAEVAKPRDESPSMAALHAAVEEQLAVYWLLVRAATARHGSEAVARRLPPALLALATLPAQMRFQRNTRLTLVARGTDGAPTITLASCGVTTLARLRVLEAEAYLRDGDASSAARMALLRLAVYHGASIGLELTRWIVWGYLAWSITCALLRLVCAVVGVLVRAPGAAWRMALAAARAVAAHVA
jgi:hypothetical protein